MTKSNFESMSRAELKADITTHRKDDEAFRIYLDRLRTNSDIKIISGRCDDEGMKTLKSLIKQRIRDNEGKQ